MNAAGLPAFRPVFDALSRMGFYNLSPAKIRQLQQPDQGDLLEREGTNLPAVLARLERTAPEVKQRIAAYLGYVVSGIEDVSTLQVGHMETLEFFQRVAGAKAPWRFPAMNMSDGTLRALAVLTAIFQFGSGASTRLVGIEEPETALHPAAANLLLDCLREGARDRQIIVTTHSPDMLDDVQLTSEGLLAVASTDGSHYHWSDRRGQPARAGRLDVHRRRVAAPQSARAGVATGAHRGRSPGRSTEAIRDVFVNLGVIVEGHGECVAVPILIRRIAELLGVACTIAAPLRVGRLKLLQAGQLERAVTRRTRPRSPRSSISTRPALRARSTS